MKTIKTVESSCKKHSIKVVQSDDGSYHLQRYETKYDPEEEKFYTIAHLPHPAGRYSSLESAVTEAESALK